MQKQNKIGQITITPRTIKNALCKISQKQIIDQQKILRQHITILSSKISN